MPQKTTGRDGTFCGTIPRRTRHTNLLSTGNDSAEAPLASTTASALQESVGPSHPAASPAQCQNPAPALDAEIRRQADESAVQTSIRRSAPLRTDPRPQSPEPAACAQSAAARRQTPAGDRRDPPTARLLTCARIPATTHRTWSLAP